MAAKKVINMREYFAKKGPAAAKAFSKSVDASNLAMPEKKSAKSKAETKKK